MISQSKMSKSKAKAIIHNIPSVDLLYKGYQRKLSLNQYVKHFPKLKLNPLHKNINLSSSKCLENEELFSREILSLKQQNRRLEDVNGELKIRIKKESKMNEIYEKRIQSKDIEAISFDKLLEIKLLMQVEQFEETLKRRQQELVSVTKLTKTKKQQIDNINYGPYIDLHELILDESRREAFKKQKQDDLAKLSQVLQSKRRTRLRLKNDYRKLMQQLRALKSEIDKERSIMSHIPKSIEDSESGALSLQSKNKNMEQIEGEIVRIVKECGDYEIKIQRQMDKRISEKILILNEIERLSKPDIRSQGLKTAELKLIW